MANKFLPFIVKDSTPVQIFNRIVLLYGNNVNCETIASIFLIVLKHNITELRKYVNTLPNMSYAKVCEQIINQYPNYRVTDKVLQEFTGLSTFFLQKDVGNVTADLRNHSVTKILTFFAVMVKYTSWDISEYSSINFREFGSDKRETILNDLQSYISFSNAGTPVQFSDTNSLKFFILYHTLISNEPIPDPICAVLVQKPSVVTGVDSSE